MRFIKVLSLAAIVSLPGTVTQVYGQPEKRDEQQQGQRAQQPQQQAQPQRQQQQQRAQQPRQEAQPPRAAAATARPAASTTGATGNGNSSNSAPSSLNNRRTRNGNSSNSAPSSLQQQAQPTTATAATARPARQPRRRAEKLRPSPTHPGTGPNLAAAATDGDSRAVGKGNPLGSRIALNIGSPIIALGRSVGATAATTFRGIVSGSISAPGTGFASTAAPSSLGGTRASGTVAFGS